MDDKLKNYWLEKIMKKDLNEKETMSDFLATLLVSDILVPTEIYLGGKDFNKENMIWAFKNNELKVSYLLCDLLQNGEKRIVMFTSNSRSTLPLPEPYNLFKMTFRDFLINEYDFENLRGIVINPYHESVVLNDFHLKIIFEALSAKSDLN